jgi:BlaI family transcriptional regulator, penicillinase repressor
MKTIFGPKLSRRERQILDVLYERERASVAEVLAALPDPPSYSAVRALLAILEKKGHVTHVEEGKRYLYLPAQPRQSAARAALKQLIHTFFAGNAGQAVATLLADDELTLTEQELEHLARLIEEAKEGIR